MLKALYYHLDILLKVYTYFPEVFLNYKQMSDNLKSIKDVWCYLSGLVIIYLWHFAFDTYNKTRCEIRCMLYFCIFTCRFQLHVFTHSVCISSNTYLQFSSISNVLKISTTTVWRFVSLCVLDLWDPLCKVTVLVGWPISRMFFVYISRKILENFSLTKVLAKRCYGRTKFHEIWV